MPPAEFSTDDHHFRRADRGEHWKNIAAHLARHPGDLDIALANIQRWLDWGRAHPAPIIEWRSRILAARQSPAAMTEFLAYLAEPNHDSELLKSCSPFVGLQGLPTLT